MNKWLTLTESCDWLNITERHARKVVARDAIPYRKVMRPRRQVKWPGPRGTSGPSKSSSPFITFVSLSDDQLVARAGSGQRGCSRPGRPR